jgi:flavin reductase (DIM6/NTAB) family NADH-FMN oxidoreductase RutF
MTLAPYETDLALLRKTFSFFPTGVAAIAAEIDGRPNGMVVSTFTVGVSMDPPMVLFSVQNESTTWPEIHGAERLGISVLGEGMGPAARQLSSRNKESRFDGLDIETSEAGAVFVHGSAIWLECTIRSENLAGDHHVVLLNIESLHADADVNPLIYHGSSFRSLAEL